MKYVRSGVMLCVFAAGLVHAAPPDGWLLAGSKPANYETGMDGDAANAGVPSAFSRRRRTKKASEH